MQRLYNVVWGGLILGSRAGLFTSVVRKQMIIVKPAPTDTKSWLTTPFMGAEWGVGCGE
jgi:hypothetical protein